MHVCRIKTNLRLDTAFYFTKVARTMRKPIIGKQATDLRKRKKKASPKRGHGNKILRHIALL